MRKVSVLLAFAFLILILIAVYNWYTELNGKVSYEDGGEGFVIATTLDELGGEHVQFLDKEDNVIIELDKIFNKDTNVLYSDIFMDEMVQYLRVWPFHEGYAKIAIVNQFDTVSYVFINKKGEIEFRLTLEPVYATLNSESKNLYTGFEYQYEGSNHKVFDYYGVSDVVGGKVVIAERSKGEPGYVGVFDVEENNFVNRKYLGLDYEKEYYIDYENDKDDKYGNSFYVDDIGFIVKEASTGKAVYMDTKLEIVR